MTQQKKAEGASRPIAETLSAAESTAIDGARDRIRARGPRFVTRLETDKAGAVVEIGPEHSDRDGWLARLDDLFGSSGRAFPLSQLNHVLQISKGSKGYDKNKANALLSAVEGAKPANEIEAMLALQMAITHELALQSLARAQRVDQIPQFDSACGMAVRLLRTFTAQAEALAKLQRGGEQVVKVVHVHPGAQAVIGNVTSAAALPGGGGSEKNGDQPHAPDEEQRTAPRSITAERLAPMPCADEARQPVPVPAR